MIFKKICLGSLFILASAFIYEFDKALSYFKWAAYIISINGNGGYNAQPDKITIFDNYFIILFFLIGILFYINAFISFKNINKK